MDQAQRSASVNGVELAYLDAGEGPLVVMVHGFPDDARTWSHQVPVLVDAGYRVVTPYLRGYPPSQVPQDGSCNSKTNASDLVGLLQALGGDPAFVVGHDWGSLAAFAAMAVAPELVRRTVVVAGSHPGTLLNIFERPEIAHHLFHVWLFQLEGFAEHAVKVDDLALVDYLWSHWTADGTGDPAHVERVKRDTLGQPGVIDALIPYYRALVRLPQDAPDFVETAGRPTTVPTLAVWGGDDVARGLADGEESLFEAEYRRVDIPGAGHFPHREQHEAFNEVLLEWLSSDREPEGASGSAPAASTA